MIRTYTYRCRRVRKTQREALDALFRHLAWLRNDAVAHCRNEFAEGGKTPSTFDLYKRLTAMRQDNAYNAAQPVRAQRSMLQRVHAAYDKFFGEGKGRPRFKPEVRSFELEGTVPRKNGPYHTLQIKGVGKLRFKDKRGVLSGRQHRPAGAHPATPFRHRLQRAASRRGGRDGHARGHRCRRGRKGQLFAL